jgi:hypothetical protein
MFKGWSSGRNVMTGSEGKLPVTLFDYTTIIEGGESSTVTHGTAVLLRVNGLPAFDLRPRTFGRRVLGWAGFEGMTFDPSAAHPADAGTIQRFSERFYLAPTDPLATIEAMAKDHPPENDEPEKAVRILFTPPMMAALNEYPAYAIQSRPGFLAVWRGDNVLPARMRTELWDAAVELTALLTRPPRSGSGPAIPGKAGKDASRQIRKVQKTLLGGVVGLFVGFILSAIAMPIVFFRRDLGQGLGLGFFVEPLLFFGLILGGVVIGAAIASRLPVRDLPPQPAEDPVRRKARQKASTYGAVVGFLGGFFGGFALFVGSKILFHWNLDDRGVDAALFFGSIFGGALLGAVTCGMVVNRWYRWRQTGDHSQLILADRSDAEAT